MLVVKKPVEPPDLLLHKSGPDGLLKMNAVTDDLTDVFKLKRLDGHIVLRRC